MFLKEKFVGDIWVLGYLGKSLFPGDSEVVTVRLVSGFKSPVLGKSYKLCQYIPVLCYF